jgi:RNA polymerase sigma factor (sigma-70 family)
VSNVRTAPAQQVASAQKPQSLLTAAWHALSDAELVDAAQQLDARAFEILMRRHNRRLFRAARSILHDADAAEDAVQEAYIRAFTHLSSYAPTGSFAAWLTRIAINEALMLKRRLKRPALSLDEIDGRADGDQMHASWRVSDVLATTDSSEQASIRQLLEQALDRLPQDFRIVFVLREVEQLSIAETADCLGLHATTVKTRLHRARAKLRAALTRRIRREQLQLFEFGGERCDRIVAAVLRRLSDDAASRSIGLAGPIVGLAFAALLMCGAPIAYGDARPSDAAESYSDVSALKEIRKGREIFRRATFGDEDFWGGTLGLHEAIAGAANGGVGPGLSPKAALSLGLKVDSTALPGNVKRALRSETLNLNDPAVTLELLRLDAVVGVTGFFDEARRLKSVGIQCALCHSVVDDSFAPGVGRRLDGWANRDLNIGAIAALAPRLQVLSTLLGVDVATVRTVLRSWGPGKFDAELLLDGKAFQPDGRSAATLIPPAFGLAGVNLHTWTGWGSVTHWNAFVANLEMHGKGTFFDPRLDDADRFPIAARERFGHVVAEEDQITPALAPLHLFQLSLKAPAAPRGSYDANAAKRGGALFSSKAQCSTCHVPPLFTEPGWNMHTPDEIGIDDFQANRAPDGRYRTAPLRGLWTHTRGGFYHDGRFATLADVIAHYDQFFKLGLTAGERRDLEEYLKSL